VPLANQIVNIITFLATTSGSFFKTRPCFQEGSMELSLWNILIKTLLEILMEIRNPNNFRYIDRQGEWFYQKVKYILSNISSHRKNMRQTTQNTWCGFAIEQMIIPKLIRYCSAVRHGRLISEPTAVSKSYKIRGSHSGVADNSNFWNVTMCFCANSSKCFKGWYCHIFKIQQHERSMIHRDVGNHSQTDIASLPSQPASSVCSNFL
jgi:hypothetical protein